MCRTHRFYQRQDSGVGTLTLRTETLWIPGTLTTRILIRPKELKHCFKVGCCGAQALHNSKEGSRGTQALHNDRIPGTLTTRILEGGRRTLTLHIGKEEGRRGTQALHNDIMGCRGTQALHDEWIPGTLTTRIQHACRGTQALRDRNSYVGTLTLRTQILNS